MVVDEQAVVGLPLVGVTNFVGDGPDFLPGAVFGGFVHPGEGGKIVLEGLLDESDHLARDLFPPRAECRLDVGRAECLPKCPVRGRDALLPARQLLLGASEVFALEAEALILEALGKRVETQALEVSADGPPGKVTP